MAKKSTLMGWEEEEKGFLKREVIETVNSSVGGCR